MGWHVNFFQVKSFFPPSTSASTLFPDEILFFVSVVIGTRARLNLIFKKVCEKAKRFYEIAAFFHYAVADGIHRLLFGLRTGSHEAAPARFSGQMVFDFLKPLI